MTEKEERTEIGEDKERRKRYIKRGKRTNGREKVLPE